MLTAEALLTECVALLVLFSEHDMSCHELCSRGSEPASIQLPLCKQLIRFMTLDLPTHQYTSCDDHCQPNNSNISDTFTDDKYNLK